MLQQTRRHSYICHLLGIRELVLVINKMDLVDFSQEIFERIVLDYKSFSRKIGIESFSSIPVSGLKGDNITEKSDNTPWYRGPALLSFLNIDIGYSKLKLTRLGCLFNGLTGQTQSFADMLEELPPERLI